MTMDNHVHDAKKAGVALYPLGGTWFRRERERIAIGRPAVAAHLGVTVGRLAKLERENEAVPASWWLLLPGLGFVNPWTPILSLNASTVEQAAKPSPSTMPPRAPATDRARVLPAPSPARGLWLRGRRLDLGLSLQTLSEALGLTRHDLGTLEWQNMLVPPTWMPTLATLGFCRPANPADPSPLVSLYTGAWLQRERQRKNHTPESCAIPLGVSAGFLALLEARDWPLTPEWIPILAQLGIADQDPAPPPIGQDQSKDDKTVSPPAETVKPSAEGNDKTGEPMPENAQGGVCPLPLGSETRTDGPWLRMERQRLGLSQTDLKTALRIQLCTLRSAESRKTHVPEVWLSTLGSLGFRLPPHLATWNPSALDELRLSGSWLLKARTRRMLPLAQVCKSLGVDQATLKKIEKYDRPLPAAWLFDLKRLGLRFPRTMVAQSAKPEGANLMAPSPSAHEAPTASKATVVEQSRHTILPSFEHRQDLVEAAFNYRLRVGRSTGQRAFEVLVKIVEDVQQAGLEATITYEALDVTIQALKRQRVS